MEFITENLEIIILSILGLILICLILFLIMTVRYTKLRKSYLSMLKGTNVPDIEEVIIQIREEIKAIGTNQVDHANQIGKLQSLIKQMKAKIGIHRYDAFNGQGTDLSFSLAIVDDYQNGIVLTGLHSRDETYMYAKPLEKGNSTYALSTEEKQAIHQALNMEM